MSELERALVDLGRHVRFPDTPDLAASVRGALESPAAPAVLPVAPRLRRGAVLAAALLTMLVAGLLSLSPAVRAAILRVFVLPGVRIVIGPGELAPARPLGEGLALGRRVPLEEAEERLGFDVGVPARLGDPDEVYLAEPSDRVSLAYRARPGLPEAHATGLGLLLTEFRAALDEQFLKKLVDADVARIRSVSVDGVPGYWVEGPHTLHVVGEGGLPVADRARLAGNTLLWSRSGVTYRLEAEIGLQRALAIAASVR